MARHCRQAECVLGRMRKHERGNSIRDFEAGVFSELRTEELYLYVRFGGRTLGMEVLANFFPVARRIYKG